MVLHKVIVILVLPAMDTASAKDGITTDKDSAQHEGRPAAAMILLQTKFCLRLAASAFGISHGMPPKFCHQK